MKSALKIITISLVILFISLYVTQLNSNSSYYTNQKTILTDEAIKRFEEDIKEGKEIDTSNYLVEEKHYNNNLTNYGMKVSSIIEKSFNKTMNKIFKELETAINTK